MKKYFFFLFFFFASILLFGYDVDDYPCGKITGGFKDYPSKNAAQLLNYQYAPDYGKQMQILEQEIATCKDEDPSRKFHLYYAYYCVSRKKMGLSTPPPLSILYSLKIFFNLVFIPQI